MFLITANLLKEFAHHYIVACFGNLYSRTPSAPNFTLQENLRQMCLYDISMEDGKPEMWWKYSAAFWDACGVTKKKYGVSCSEKVNSRESCWCSPQMIECTIIYHPLLYKTFRHMPETTSMVIIRQTLFLIVIDAACPITSQQ